MQPLGTKAYLLKTYSLTAFGPFFSESVTWMGI